MDTQNCFSTIVFNPFVEMSTFKKTMFSTKTSFSSNNCYKTFSKEKKRISIFWEFKIKGQRKTLPKKTKEFFN